MLCIKGRRGFGSKGLFFPKTIEALEVLWSECEQPVAQELALVGDQVGVAAGQQLISPSCFNNTGCDEQDTKDCG